jgi:hypothetical protein
MEKTDHKTWITRLFRNFLDFLESRRHGSYIQNSIPSDSIETQRGSERSFPIDSENISGRLQNLGESRISGRLDEEISATIPALDNLDNMKTPYDVELPPSPEEKLQNSSYEWVKTERAGEVCKFKEIIKEGNTEYIGFTDGTRVRSSLVGDVVLQHEHPAEILGANELAIKPVQHLTSVIQHPTVIPSPTLKPTEVTVPQTPTRIETSPVLSILEKSKKKKKKVQFDFMMEIPSSDVLSIIKENFDASETELFDFFVSKIDKKKFVSAIILGTTDK